MATPGWLVSSLLDLLIVLLLALFTIAPHVKRAATIIAGSSSTDEAPLLEALQFVPQKLDAPEAV